MRHLITAAFCLAVFTGAQAQGLGISAADTLHTVAAAQKGKRITVRLRSGQEITGTVTGHTERLIVLAEVANREFFDAVIAVDAIEAVLVRTKP